MSIHVKDVQFESFHIKKVIAYVVKLFLLQKSMQSMKLLFKLWETTDLVEEFLKMGYTYQIIVVTLFLY